MVQGFWSVNRWCEYSNCLSDQVEVIFRELKNLLLLDLHNVFGSYFRAWEGGHKFRGRRTLFPNLGPNSFSEALLRSAGIKQAEIIRDGEKPHSGPLHNLKASIIKTGPFDLALTNNPSCHLRFDEDKRQPTILLLDSDTISKLAILESTGLMG